MNQLANYHSFSIMQLIYKKFLFFLKIAFLHEKYQVKYQFEVTFLSLTLISLSFKCFFYYIIIFMAELTIRTFKILELSFNIVKFLI